MFHWRESLEGEQRKSYCGEHEIQMENTLNPHLIFSEGGKVVHGKKSCSFLKLGEGKTYDGKIKPEDFLSDVK